MDKLYFSTGKLSLSLGTELKPDNQESFDDYIVNVIYDRYLETLCLVLQRLMNNTIDLS
jgi:hypothetical protein